MMNFTRLLLKVLLQFGGLAGSVYPHVAQIAVELHRPNPSNPMSLPQIVLKNLLQRMKCQKILDALDQSNRWSDFLNESYYVDAVKKN